MNLYNENDAKAAAWLAELIKRGLVAPGRVITRSIVDLAEVSATQVHLFAGIGGWSYALRLAGWPDDLPVWTGSCPCQPFSVAGKGKGTDDERHLWPEMRRLVELHEPPVVFGEQVASTAGRNWLAAVRTDLEALGYAVGAADLCAAGVGAPHIRARLYWSAIRVADTNNTRRRVLRVGRVLDKVGSTLGHNLDGRSKVRGLADTNKSRLEGRLASERTDKLFAGSPSLDREWVDCDWLPCADGKTRPVEPGTFPLANGVPARVGRLRGYGNAVVPQVATAFIKAVMEAL